jgi:hypothetical protein
MRTARGRLGPRGDDVEEQTNEGHADRERVKQLNSPPSQWALLSKGWAR